MSIRVIVAIASTILVASCLAPSNPFDPDAPPEQQERARIVGRVLGDFNNDTLLLTVVDDSGQLLRDVDKGSALRTFPTLAQGAPVPDLLEEGPGKAFEITDLVPGRYAVVFDAELNEEPLLQDASSDQVELLAGDLAVRNLTPAARSQSDLTGSVTGTVEGAEGGASFTVRLIAQSGNADVAQQQSLSEDGTFSFRNVADGQYRMQVAGDSYAPSATPFFSIAGEAVVLEEPLRLTTLGRIFFLDDFRGDEGLPPFSPFVQKSPVHVAVAPLALTNASLVAFARVYTDDARPEADEGWLPLTGAADLLEAAFDIESDDGPRTVLAQLRLCFESCECIDVDEAGDCIDDDFQTPLISRELALDFVLDTTAPRALSVQVDDTVRAVFAGTAAELEESPAVVSVSCARFGSAQCALATIDTARAAISGDLLDDMSRLVGFAITLDDEEVPTTFEPVTTLGQTARISATAPPIAKISGEHVLRIWALDAANNLGLVDVRRMVVDVEDPAPVFLVNDGAAFTNEENVTLTIDDSESSPIASIRVENTAATFTGGALPFAATVVHQLATPDVNETKVVFLQATSASGNIAIAQASIFLDKTAPSGTVTIASGAARTNSRTVNMALAFDLADVFEHAITTADTGFPADCSGVTFEDDPPPVTSQVILAATSGTPETRTVSVCTRDRAGNTSLALDTIVLDEDVPAGSVTLNGGSSITTSRNLTATITAPSDTAEIKLSLQGPGAPAALDCETTGYEPFTTATLAQVIGANDDAGLYTIQVCLKDGAGNISRNADGVPAPVSDDIIFDDAAPTVSLAVNDDGEFTTSSQVTLTITAGDDLSSPLGGIVTMRVANTTLIFSGEGEPFSSSRAVTLISPTEEGTKTVCVEVTDAAGRTATACDDIEYDLVAPVGTVVIARTSGNFSQDADASLSTTFRSTDASIAAVFFGEAPLDCPSVDATAFFELASSTNLVADVTVTEGEGARSITGCFRAQSGLISSTTDTVFVDPTDPALAITTAPTSGAFVANKRPTLAWQAVTGAKSYNVIGRRKATGVAEFSATVVSTNFTPSSDLVELEIEWLVQAVKPSGRVSVIDFTSASTFTLDATLPIASTSLVLTSGRNLITSGQAGSPVVPCLPQRPCINDAVPSLAFTAGVDGQTTVSHTVEVALAGDFSTPDFTATRSNGDSFRITTPLEDGVYKWRVKTRDAAGNTVTSVPSEFVVDKTAPDSPSIVPPLDPVSQAGLTAINLLWTNEGPTGATNYRFEITTEALGFSQPLRSVTQPSTGNNVNGILTNGSSVRHLFRVASLDALGNQSSFSSSAFIHDSEAPCTSSSSVEIIGNDNDNLFSDSRVVTVNIFCSGGNPFQMQVGCDGNADGKPFVGFASVATCVLPGGAAEKTVAVNIRDAAGNVHAPSSDTITVDTTAPTTPVIATADTVTNLALFNVVIDEPSTDTNFSHHEFIDGVNVVDFTPMIDLEQLIGLGPTNRTFNVRIRGVDKAGNASPEALVKLTFDDIPPIAPIILGSGTTKFVNDATFTFTLDRSSQSESDANFQTYQTALCTGNACTPTPFTTNPSRGTFTFNLFQNVSTTFALRARDSAGNLSAADSITVVEDSVVPRPVALEPLPDSMLGGTVTITNIARGPYADVFFSRNDTSVLTALPTIDANFDHYEVRGATTDFLGFVPMCAAATPTCPFPEPGETFLDPRDFIIRFEETIVGFRIPLVRGELNQISLRTVDKAGNVSGETTTVTQEITDQRITNDSSNEFAVTVFGDKITYIDDKENRGFVHEAGRDNLWGTNDDTKTEFSRLPFVEMSDGGKPVPVIAMGPNVLFFPSIIVDSDSDSGSGTDTVLVMNTTGEDGIFGPTITEPVDTIGEDPSGIAVPLRADTDIKLTQPSFWVNRLAYRLKTTATPSDSDIIVRQAGADGVFGNADDTFTKVADDAEHQLFPQISGNHIAFFRCSAADEADCGNPTALRLTVTSAGVDAIFGTIDDVTNELPQATNIDRMRPQLYAPQTPGRPACRNVVAYAGKQPQKGVFVIAAGPEGSFSDADVPVQVTQQEGLDLDNMSHFALYDDMVASAYDFTPPVTEVVMAGRDGCLTNTADNISRDIGFFAAAPAIWGNVIVSQADDPTNDLVWTEFASERPLWTRTEGQGNRFSSNSEVDRRGVVFGKEGGFYDFASRTMRIAFEPVSSDEAETRAGLLAHSGALNAPNLALFVRGFGEDEIFGTADDDAEVNVAAVFPLHQNNNRHNASGLSFGLEDRTVVWAGTVANQVAPYVRTAGANGFGADDCVQEVGGGNLRRVGYSSVRVNRSRMAFSECGDFACNSFNTTTPLFVREVEGDVCSGAETVQQLAADANFPEVDGQTFLFQGNNVTLIDGGKDHRLTVTADNKTRTFFQPAGISLSQRGSISSDRVVWVDARSETVRVILGDAGDMGTRTLTRSERADEDVSIEGDVVHYLTGTREGIIGPTDSRKYVFGIDPDLPQDLENPGPTRLSCPTDDDFEENDSRATAKRLNNGGMVNGIVCSPDIDIWKIEVPTDCTLRASASFAHVDGDLDISLVDPNDQNAGSSEGTGDNEVITKATTVTGDYLLTIVGFQGASNAYDVGVAFTCP